MRLTPLAAALLVAALAPSFAAAMTLDEAIALAEKTSPAAKIADADQAAAAARLAEARSGYLPSVTLQGETGHGPNDLGGFFGFKKKDTNPRAVSLEAREHLFTGGAVQAGVEAARAGDQAARHGALSAREALAVNVAEVYGGVLAAEALYAATAKYRDEVGVIAGQAKLRFNAGEIPRSELAKAEARAAEARAAYAKAQSGLAVAREAFRALVGEAPDHLDTPISRAAASLDVEAALAEAERGNEALAAARDAWKAAKAGVRRAQAEHLPMVDLTASTSSVRDQFFPGYRSDATVVGVQGRWTLFAGGGISARVAEARAAERKAAAEFDAAERGLRVQVAGAVTGLDAAQRSLDAAHDQALAADVALDSLRHETRVGQKTTADLLDGEREALSAAAAEIAARADLLAAGLRLDLTLGRRAWTNAVAK
jgi:outer membrane protein